MSSQRSVAEHRRRQTERGYVRVEVQLPQHDAERVREFARLMRDGGEHAELLRHLIPVAGEKPARTGLDLLKAVSMGESLDVPDDLFERSRVWPRDYTRDVDL